MSCLIELCFLFYVPHSSNNCNVVTCIFTGFTEIVHAVVQHVLTYSLVLQKNHTWPNGVNTEGSLRILALAPRLWKDLSEDITLYLIHHTSR